MALVMRDGELLLKTILRRRNFLRLPMSSTKRKINYQQSNKKKIKMKDIEIETLLAED